MHNMKLPPPPVAKFEITVIEPWPGTFQALMWQDGTGNKLEGEGEGQSVHAAVFDLLQQRMDLMECEGHESTDGPIGNVVFCDGSCRP